MSLFAAARLAVFFGALAACAPSPKAPANEPSSPKYMTVHVDSLAPTKFAQFESARREWVTTLRTLHTSDQRGLFAQLDANAFLTFRPFSSFAELDTRSGQRKRALAAVPTEVQDKYDDQSDDALVFPHRQEIWALEEELCYRPGRGALQLTTALVAELRIDAVHPTAERDYEKAWQEERGRLAAVRFPLTKLSFSSVYGDGRVYSFWLARSADELTTHLQGAADSSASFPPAKCIVSTTTHRVVFRGDLSAI